MGRAKAYLKENADKKQEWRLSQPQFCMLCGKKADWLPLSVHEIERRGHAPTRWGEVCNYLLICCRCHEGPFATMKHSVQLAIKLIRDPENYDLQAWLRIKDKELRAPNRVTQDEVDAVVNEIISKTISKPA